MSNNRAEISRKLIELKLEYESLDRFFYSNFKICTENFTPYIKAKPYACCEYTRRIDSIKGNISRLWQLCNSHTGGWFDNYAKQEIDQKNKNILTQIEQDVKNILVLQNWLERIRKEVTNKVLSIKRISEFLNFPILAQPTLKKI